MTVVFLDPPCDPWAREGFENFTRGLPPEVEILIPEGATLALRLNTGMEEAREEQVVFFRGSGYPFAHCIDAVRKKQESGFWDVLSAPIDLVDSGDQFVRQIPPGLGSLSRILFEEVPPPGSHGLCLTKTAFRKVGPFRGLLDEATVLDWSLRAEALGCSLGEIEKPVAVLRAEGPMGGTGASDRVATVLGLLESFQTPGNLSAIRATLAGTFDVAGLLALRSQWNGEGETGGVIPALIDDRILELDPSLWRSLWTEARPIPGIGNSPHLDSRNKGGRRTTGELRRTSDPYPLVSVITPTYNAEKYLGRCLLSVFNQTYPNIEILVIDGGSTDNTVSMLKEWESRIDFWKTEKDAGVYEAMNKGLALAAGEIIVILNADDYFAPTAVERAVRCLRSGHADYTLGGCVFVDSEESTVSRKMPSTIDASSLFNYSTASHQSIFAERKVYSLIGDYDTSYTIAADYKFRNLLLLSGLSYAMTPGVSVYCTLGGLSTNVENRDKCLDEVYRIAIQTSKVDTRVDVEFLVLLASKGEVSSEPFRRYSFLADKYQFSDNLMLALEKRIFVAESSKSHESSNNYHGAILQVKRFVKRLIGKENRLGPQKDKSIA